MITFQEEQQTYGDVVCHFGKFIFNNRGGFEFGRIIISIRKIINALPEEDEFRKILVVFLVPLAFGECRNADINAINNFSPSMIFI